MSRIQDVRKRVEPNETALRAVSRDLVAFSDESGVRPMSVSAIENTIPEKSDPLSEISDSTLLDVLSRSPRLDWLPDPKCMLFLGGKSTAAVTEEFRALRFRLCETRKERSLKSLLVTSAVPGEGKSFVAANLAQVMAVQPGSRVLLLDADLRNPRLHSMLGTASTPGLSDYLLDEVEEPSIMQRGQDDALFFIPSGCPVPTPTELLTHERLQLLIRKLETIFDWIIVDSPAATLFTDACALSNCCDGVLMVVRASSTPFDVVRKARERFSSHAVVGAILNRIESEKGNKNR